MTAFYLAIFGAPALVIALGALAASASRNRRETLLTTTGRQAFGRVLDVGQSDDGLGLVSYWIRVEFDYDGEPVTASVTVSQREQQRYRVGQRVGLTFAASRHKVVRLDPPEWSPSRAA
jgi:hypothetical protein